MPLVTLLILVGVATILFYSFYVSIIRKRNKVQEAYSGIDVQLKKRHDLIPNVLAIAKKFMTHEKELMNEITELRTKAMKHGGAENAAGVKKALMEEAALGHRLSQLMIGVENYPDLKSDESMENAQRMLKDVEEHIAASRRFYNSAVRELSDTIQIWPMSMVASWIKVEPYPFFEMEESEKAAPDAASLLA